VEGWYEYGCICENVDEHPPDDLEATHVHRTRRRLRERPFHDGTHETAPPVFTFKVETESPVFTFKVTTSRPNDDRPVRCPLCGSACGPLNRYGPGIPEE
jgi:hypothetical protein